VKGDSHFTCGYKEPRTGGLSPSRPQKHERYTESLSRCCIGMKLAYKRQGVLWRTLWEGAVSSSILNS